MPNITVFDNGAYVDTADGSGSEADNTRVTLINAGHTVSTFTAIDAAGLSAALAGQNAVVIPEMERGTWIPGAAEIAILQNFVASGGTLVIHGFSGNQASFLNSVFGFAVAETGVSGPFTKTAAATGSALSAAAASLPSNNGTEGLSLASLPAGSRSFYEDGSSTVMVDMPYGAGSVVFVGWDWFSALPAGSQDNGWLGAYGAVLAETISQEFVVNFDSTTNSAPSGYSEDGLTFTSPTHMHFGIDMDGDGKPEVYGHNGGSEIIEITRTGGGSFSLIDMDISTSAGSEVEWIAYRWVGGSYVETGRMVIAPGTEVTFTGDFHNIDKVVWNSAYTPSGFLAVDNIRYTVGGSSVTNADPEVTGPVTSTVDEDDAPYSVDLLAGASDDDGDPLTISGLTLDSGYASGITVNGTSLDVDPDAYSHLAVGESEVITYSYTIEDGNGGLVAQTATITITGVNDTPTVSAAITSTASEDDAPYSIDLLAGSDDDDFGAVLGVSDLALDSGDDAGVSVNGNSLDIDPDAYNALGVGEQEVITYSYNVTDEHGASVAQTATVTITGVNDGPTANDDDLSGGASGGALRVGYYDMYYGLGQANQVASIIAAGHTPVLITDLSDVELADIDILVVQNPDNGGYGAEYLARMAAVNAAVEGGLKLIIHDRHVDSAETILPGSSGFSIVGDFSDSSNIEFNDDAHSVASGPGGALNDVSLDFGTHSSHGFAIAGTLPATADLILSTGDATHVVTFSYGHGAGHVVYSSIPIDFYLEHLFHGHDHGDGMFDNADNYLVNLLDHVAVDLGAALTDEDTAVVIDTADLLANDTDPDTNDVLVVSAVDAASALGAAVTLNVDGTISYNPAGMLDYLAEGEVVEDSFTYTVDDGNGGTDTATVTFKVVGVNDGPSAPVDTDGPSGASISEHLAVGSLIGLDADATDPEGDTVNYFFRDGGGNVVQTLGKFAIDATSGAVTLVGAVNYELDNSYSLRIYASDGSIESYSDFTVTITNVVEHLFTPNNDGTAAAPINFNLLADGSYDFDDAYYDALSGNDFVYLPNQGTVDIGNPWDYSKTFSAGSGNDVIQGGDGDDIVSGGEGHDRLFGATGDDRLVGASGDDILAGGDGSDKLTGSSGRDIFVFTDTEIGTTRLGEHDTITDFKQGEDKIDISALYDGGMFGGVQSGTAAQAANASGYKVYFFTDSGKTWIMGDTNGVAGADFAIELSGSYKLKGTDFVANQSFIASQAQWTSATGGLDYAKHHQEDYFL